MTTEVAKPEGEDVGPFRADQAKRSAGGANRLVRMLGPGLVTGASDDDPSGIGTYSQTRACTWQRSPDAPLCRVVLQSHFLQRKRCEVFVEIQRKIRAPRSTDC